MPIIEEQGRQAARAILQKLGEPVYFMVQVHLKRGYDIDLESDFDYGILQRALVDMFGAGSEVIIREMRTEKMRIMATMADA